MPPSFIPIIVFIGVVALFMGGAFVLMLGAYRKVPSGKALIVDRMGKGRTVSLTSAVVYPRLNSAELVDLTAKTIRIERGPKNPLVTRDGVFMHATANFVVRISRNEDDILKVAETFGVERANSLEYVTEHFTPRFDQALEAVFGAMTAADVISERMKLVDQVIVTIGVDLNGFYLDDVAVHDVLRDDA